MNSTGDLNYRPKTLRSSLRRRVTSELCAGLALTADHVARPELCVSDNAEARDRARDVSGSARAAAARRSRGRRGGS